MTMPARNKILTFPPRLSCRNRRRLYRFGPSLQYGLDRKYIEPSEIVQVSDIVEVMVLEIDEERRRIGLRVKQCHIKTLRRIS
jgi:hypothetical protein